MLYSIQWDENYLKTKRRLEEEEIGEEKEIVEKREKCRRDWGENGKRNNIMRGKEK